MVNKIPIIIDERGSVKKDITILAMENENLSKTFSILLPNSIINEWLYIEFEKADGIKFVTPKLTANNNYLEYNLGINLLDVIGKLVCQVVAKDESGVVWKSNKFDFSISGSINAIEKVIESNPDILADLQRQINNIEVSGGAGLTDYYTKSDVDAMLSTKQDTLIAGSNISIVDNVISAGGGSSTIPVEEISGVNITLEPNKHYVIKDVTNSLTISLAEPITTELKHYSFEFSTIDRIPKVTINGVDQPYNYEYAKDTKYLCEIVNNHLVILGVYDGYLYQFIYGMFASADYTASYTFKNDRTFTEVVSGTTKSGTYKIEVSNEQYTGILTFEDSSIKMFIYANGTITIDGVVYTKIS